MIQLFPHGRRLLWSGLLFAIGTLFATCSVSAAAPAPGRVVVTSNLTPARTLPRAGVTAALPGPDVLKQRVAATWPDDSNHAVRILRCESTDGLDPQTYDLDAPNGGPMQINRDTWAGFFADNFGWSWDDVVNNLDIHLEAARYVYDDSGSWRPWECYTAGLAGK